MQKYNFSFKIDYFSRKKIRILLKMLSEYYILQLHFPESKMRTIATIFNPLFLLIFFCRIIKKLYLCYRIFSENQA